MIYRDRVGLVFCVCSMLGLISPAHAENIEAAEPSEEGATPDQNGEVYAAADQANPGAARNNQVRPIIVTATRREESLQAVPLSVTALDSSALETAGIDDVRSLTLAVPGFTGGRAAMVMQPNIRGVGSIGVTIGDEGSVATYVDGIYIAGPYSSQVEMVEVERVEVLRGPQGTVFGRNATGGLVNVITPDPSFTLQGNVSAGVGFMREGAVSYDYRGYLTGPISDNIAADFAVLYRDDGDYVTDLVNGGTFDGQRTISARSKVLINPSSSVRLIFTAGYMDIEGEIPNQPFKMQAISRDAPGVIIADAPWTGALDVVPTADMDRLDLSLRAEIDLGGVTLESTTSYRNSHVTQIADSDATNIFVALSELRNANQKEYGQEVRLLSNSSSPLEWTAGLSFFGLDGTMPFFVARNAGGTTAAFLLEPDIGTRAYSAFAQGTYEMTDLLFLTLGGRFTHESRSFSQSVDGTDLFGESEVDFDKFTYNAALRYNFVGDSNIYISFGTGFKSGVFNAVGRSPDPVEPEAISALEGGIKVDLTPWLRTNVSVFNYWYDNLQVQARAADNTFVLQNAAKARIYGGEFELLMEPTDGLSLRGAFAYTHGEYRDFPGAQSFSPLPSGGNLVLSEDASGFRLVKTPRYTISLGANYNVEVGDGGDLTFGAHLFHSDRVFYDFVNLFSQDPYTLISGDVTWTPGVNGFSLSAFVKNLTNEAVTQQIRVGSTGNYTFYERPREIGVRARFEF